MTKSTVAVMDYGMGNLHSVANALRTVSPDTEVIVTADAAQIRAAERVVFPGVGAIRDCMAEIRRLGFDEIVMDVSRSKPVLAICVGMQALMSRSEENDGVECIGLFPGDVRRFVPGVGRKVPHMGWNEVMFDTGHALWNNIDSGSRFYFVHSYYVPDDVAIDGNSLRAAHTDYGVRFAAAIAHGNVFATQFHPEKSHKAGLQLLKNFLQWDGAA